MGSAGVADDVTRDGSSVEEEFLCRVRTRGTAVNRGLKKGGKGEREVEVERKRETRRLETNPRLT